MGICFRPRNGEVILKALKSKRVGTTYVRVSVPAMGVILK